jgi:hypothetical protein
MVERPLTVRPIRTSDAFVVESARLGDDPVVVVTAAAGVARADAIATLTEIARVHSSIRDSHVPAVRAVDVDADVPFVAFDCPAVCDSSALLARLAERTALIPYGAADAFIVAVRDAMRAAHAFGHTLGRLSPHNLLFAADGRFWVVGFGRNFPLEVRGAAYDVTVPFFLAPELIGGAKPSAITDFVALILFMRSVLSYVDLPERLAALLRGEVGLADAKLALLLVQFEQRVVGALPGQRASIDDAIAISNEVRRELGVVLDKDAFVAHAGRLLVGVGQAPATRAAVDASFVEGPERRDRRRWRLAGPRAAVDASFVEGPEGRTRLGRAQRRILLALTEGVSVDAAAAAGWPGESLVFDSARNRVYAVIRQLRQAGVQIERFDGGYRLAAPLTVAA